MEPTTELVLILHRLVVEVRLWVLRKWEEKLLDLRVGFWRAEGHDNSDYERRTSFNWAVTGPASDLQDCRTGSFFILIISPGTYTERK